MAGWLLKTEPSKYPFAALVRDGRTTWDGIANNLALIHLRAMKKGDQAIIFHTGNERACIGLAKLVSGPYPDPKAGDAKLVVVDLAPVRALRREIPLAEMKANPALAGFDLFRISRLSVVPVDDAKWRAILAMEG
jgi:predicted RNA-binding protein with PUA-like domain